MSPSPSFRPGLATRFLLAALALGGALGAARASSADPRLDPERFVIRVRGEDAAAKTSALEQLRALGAPSQFRLDPVVDAQTVAKWPDPVARAALARLSGWTTVHLVDPSQRGRVWSTLRSHPAVGAVEPRYLHEACATPDDALLSQQHYLPQVRAFDAYDVTTSDGEVLVAIVDGGTDWRHPDLRDNVWSRPGEVDGDGIDNDGNGYIDDVHGWNFADDSGDPTGLATMPSNARHGTHIAGIVAARSNNGIGVSGVSWNAQFLAVNVSAPAQIGGREYITFGPEGILYAALSGADVINASWGRTGRWSPFEAAILRAATELGSLVIAAAGNLETPDYFFPAFYEDALSVTRVGQDDRVYFAANRGAFVDVSAPGTQIYSTFPGATYGRLSGTSQAAAVVSGVAALLHRTHPAWSPVQIREQLRWTTLSIDEKNPGFEQKIGTGLTDAHAALTQNPPGLRVTDFRLEDADGNGIIGRAETVNVVLAVRNELSAAQSAQLQLISEDPDLLVLEDTVFLPPVPPGQSLTVSRNLEVYIPFNADTGRVTELVTLFKLDGRRVHQSHPLEALPRHHTVRGGAVAGSVTVTGKLGFSEVTRSGAPGGVGFHRTGEPTVLLGGSLLVGTGPDAVSDAMSGAYPASPVEDFRPPQFDAVVLPTPSLADHHVRVSYADADGPNPLGIWVDHSVLGFQAPGRDQFLLHVYDIQARRGALEGAHVGVLVDWELHDGRNESNRFTWDPALGLLVAQDLVGHAPWAGLVVLAAPGATHWSWLHDLRDDDQEQPGIYDAADLSRKLDDAELWNLMTEDAPPMSDDPGGVASVVSAGPFSMQEGERRRFAMALIIADDEAQLREQASAARIAYGAIASSVIRVAPRARLLANAPNPFNPRTEIRFSLPSPSHVRLAIYDSRGRLVRNLLDETKPGGVHPVVWTGADATGSPVASGVYHVRLESSLGTDRRSITLLR